MEEKKWCVYVHENKINGKRYVGITSQRPERRWGLDGYGYRTQHMFYNAIKKYGWDMFFHYVIYDNLSKYDACEIETKFINTWDLNDRKNGYNRSIGGDVNCGWKHSQEHKNYLSQKLKGRKVSHETRCKMSQNNARYWKGKTHTEDQKLQKSISMKGVRVKGLHPMAKVVVCDGVEYECVIDCANHYGINVHTMRDWLNGRNGMPKHFFDMGLKYIYSETKTTISKGVSCGRSHYASKCVICDDIIFHSMNTCANHYGVGRQAMGAWLNPNRPNKMPQKYIDLGLRYATEEEIEEYKNKLNNAS